MNYFFTLALAVCFSATTAIDDPLIQKLDAEYQALLENDPAAAQLVKAEQLLEQTNQGSRWTNYVAATKIIRQVRSKTAVPLLLKYMISHSEFGSTGSVETYAQTIALLTGKDVGDPFAGAATTDRPAAVRASVERLYRTWWLPNKQRLTTDFAKWPRFELEEHVDSLLEIAAASETSSADETVDAYRLYHVIKYDLDRMIRPSERGWLDVELHPVMLPVFLSRAGYHSPSEDATEQHPVKFASPGRVRFEVVGFLSKLRQDGLADLLDEVASDDRQDSSFRIACVLAMHVAGEDLMLEPCLSMLETERRLEPRLTLIMSLMLCRDAKLVGPTLIELLDDPNLQIRASAICAMFGSLPPAALPQLEEMTTSNRLGRYRSFLLDLIAEYRNDEAIRILGEFLQTALTDHRYRDDLSNALSALEDASGMRWRSAGAHDFEYYREKSEEAVKWWRNWQAEKKTQWADDEYKSLLTDYRGRVEIPTDLLELYGRFVGAAQRPTEESIRAFCLPNSVEVTAKRRPRSTFGYGHDLNLAYLRRGFSASIRDVRRETDDAFLIRTGTSYLRFVRTASSGWKIYDYGDEPSE